MMNPRNELEACMQAGHRVTFEACHECGTLGEHVMVPHREHYPSGKRAKTRRKPICGSCAVALVKRYRLDREDDMGASYFVEGWHAEGLRVALDVAGRHD